MLIGCHKCEEEFQFETDCESWKNNEPNEHELNCPKCKSPIILKTYPPEEE